MKYLQKARITQIRARLTIEETIEETIVETEATTEAIIKEINVVISEEITEATTIATKAHITKTIDKTGVVDETLGTTKTDSNLAVFTATSAINLVILLQHAGSENNNVDHLRFPINR